MELKLRLLGDKQPVGQHRRVLSESLAAIRDRR
jgi:hypothetical protein